MKPQNFKPGDQVEIPCEIGQGAFPTEMLVTFDTVDGPISGFVRQENIIKRDDKPDHGFVFGTIVAMTPEVISVRVRGSFFRTTGLAALSRQWAMKNLQLARAA